MRAVKCAYEQMVDYDPIQLPVVADIVTLTQLILNEHLEVLRSMDKFCAYNDLI